MISPWYDTSLNHLKSVFVHKVFVEPGDINYSLSRWMHASQIQPEGFWQAAQALEKFLKAALVLNGHNISDVRHDIVKAYDRLCRNAPELTIKDFTRPRELRDDFWGDSSDDVKTFLEYLKNVGSPDSRYGITSWHYHKDYLWKLDQIVFSVRRITIGLDWTIGTDFPAFKELEAFNGETYKEALLKKPSATVRPFARTTTVNPLMMGDSLKDHMYYWNFFFRDERELWKEKVPPSIVPLIPPFQNSHVWLWYQALSGQDELPSSFFEAVEWVCDKIPLDRGAEAAFRKKLPEAKARGR